MFIRKFDFSWTFGYYLLNAFEKDILNNWKLIFLFLKTYIFIFVYYSKLKEFYCPIGCQLNKESNFNIIKFMMIFGIIFDSTILLVIWKFIGNIYKNSER